MSEPFLATEVRHQAEYQALRATIRERGTARMVLVPIIIHRLGGDRDRHGAVITVALSTLVPLLVLAAGFEAIFALHTNVERIGRYLQVFHEDARMGGSTSPWRLAGGSLAAGRIRCSAGCSCSRFRSTTCRRPSAAPRSSWRCWPSFHLVVIARIRARRSAAAKQRALDLERFTALAGRASPRLPSAS